MPQPLDPPLRCPSAQPGMPDAQILGIISRDADGPRLAYLNERIPATPELLAQAAPADPREIFRLAARCEQSKCVHFDGARCQLATRIVEMLPEVTGSLPPCTIRRTCRWYQQEGRAACFRCPQVVTLQPPGRRAHETRRGYAACWRRGLVASLCRSVAAGPEGAGALRRHRRHLRMTSPSQSYTTALDSDRLPTWQCMSAPSAAVNMRAVTGPDTSRQ